MVSLLIANAKNDGLRLTPIRIKIFELFSTASEPLSEADLQKSIAANKSTIYRELNTLLTKNYIAEVDFADGVKRYELSSLNHHHHLICVKCKSVQDVTLEENLSGEEERIFKQKKFQVAKHALEFFGYCNNCQ